MPPETEPIVSVPDPIQPDPTPQPKQKHWLLVLLVVTGLLLLVAAVLALTWVGRRADGTTTPSLIQQIGSVLSQSGQPLKGEDSDRINVLLLGIGGGNHPGATLTDTIMVASIKPSTHQVALLSLPRDLIVVMNGEGHKINSAYVYGGIDLTIKKVTEVTGLDLQYYMLLDFSGFRKVIDDVGGVDVTIPNSFTGYYGANEMSLPCPKAQLYNLDDGAYCAISFTAGKTHLDGEQALIYARIRKLTPRSENYQLEAGDFARATRQQLTMESFKQKLFSAGTLFNPTRISTVLNDANSHILTNLNLGEMVRVGELVKGITSANIIRQVVDDATTKLVKTEFVPETGASVVVPVAGTYNYKQIQALAKGIFADNLASTEADTTNTTNTNEATTTPVITQLTTTPKVQVLNGTDHSGLAANTVALLSSLKIKFLTSGNAPLPIQTTTKMYDLSKGQRTAALASIQALLPSTVATDTELAQLLTADASTGSIDPSADFIIILGTDAITQTP